MNSPKGRENSCYSENDEVATITSFFYISLSIPSSSCSEQKGLFFKTKSRLEDGYQALYQSLHAWESSPLFLYQWCTVLGKTYLGISSRSYLLQPPVFQVGLHFSNYFPVTSLPASQCLLPQYQKVAPSNKCSQTPVCRPHKSASLAFRHVLGLEFIKTEPVKLKDGIKTLL